MRDTWSEQEVSHQDLQAAYYCHFLAKQGEKEQMLPVPAQESTGVRTLQDATNMARLLKYAYSDCVSEALEDHMTIRKRKRNCRK